MAAGVAGQYSKARPQLFSDLPRPLGMSQCVPVVVVIEAVAQCDLVTNLPTAPDLAAKRSRIRGARLTTRP